MNAKAEFIKFHRQIFKQFEDILCLEIWHETALFRRTEGDTRRTVTLAIGFSYDEFIQAVDNLDFEYDCGYGGQELFGYVWYKDGTWTDRYEYDGAECWQHNSVRIIPDHLKGGAS
jgi:hypothetical protein